MGLYNLKGRLLLRAEKCALDLRKAKGRVAHRMYSEMRRLLACQVRRGNASRAGVVASLGASCDRREIPKLETIDLE